MAPVPPRFPALSYILIISTTVGCLSSSPQLEVHEDKRFLYLTRCPMSKTELGIG